MSTRLTPTGSRNNGTECLNCGRTDIAPQVGRVVGDNQGRVFGCSECMTHRGTREFRSDATAARHALQERGRR